MTRRMIGPSGLNFNNPHHGVHDGGDECLDEPPHCIPVVPVRMMVGPLNYENKYHQDEHPWNSGCQFDPPCKPVDPDYVDPVESNEPMKADEVPGRFVTKDSGERQEYESGMRRDLQDGKPRFGLIFPKGIPYKDQFLTRFAELLERGAIKYGENNYQLANSEEELDRFRESGLRHMIQWACGEVDEDHAAAVLFNLMAYENTKRKLEEG